MKVTDEFIAISLLLIMSIFSLGLTAIDAKKNKSDKWMKFLAILTIIYICASPPYLYTQVPYTSEKIDTFDVTLEEENNKYNIRCENQLTEQVKIEILPASENSKNVYRFVGTKETTLSGKSSISGTLYIYQ